MKEWEMKQGELRNKKSEPAQIARLPTLALFLIWGIQKELKLLIRSAKLVHVFYISK